MIKDLKRGIFYISDELINENPGAIRNLFAEMEIIVLDATYDYFANNIKYVGISPYFENLVEGDAIPEYEIHRDNNEKRWLAKKYGDAVYWMNRERIVKENIE